jgi:hypothetical protein
VADDFDQPHHRKVFTGNQDFATCSRHPLAANPDKSRTWGQLLNGLDHFGTMYVTGGFTGNDHDA